MKNVSGLAISILLVISGFTLYSIDDNMDSMNIKIDGEPEQEYPWEKYGDDYGAVCYNEGASNRTVIWWEKQENVYVYNIQIANDTNFTNIIYNQILNTTHFKEIEVHCLLEGINIKLNGTDDIKYVRIRFPIPENNYEVYANSSSWRVYI